MRTEIVGHRGFSARAPENTMAAFRMAIEHGADGIEFDVHISKDGVPVVIHDPSVGRTTNGGGAVQRLDVHRLRELDAGSWYDAGFAEERIPLLDEVLALAASTGVTVYPEMKGRRTTRDLELVCDAVHRHGLLDRTVLLAFDWRDLVAAREVEPRLAIGFELSRRDRLPYALRAIERYGNAVLSFSAALAVHPRVREDARAAGARLAAWTINDPLVAVELADAGVETLITDDPATIRTALRSP